MKKRLMLLTLAALVAGSGPAMAESQNAKTRQLWHALIGGAEATEEAFAPIEARRRAQAAKPATSAGSQRGGLFGARRNGNPQTVRTARLAAPAPAVQPQRIIHPKYLPSIVRYDTAEQPGTIIIDPQAKYLYLVQDGGLARRYGVGVGREGFGWSGTVKVGRKAEWPRWVPPAEMRKRQPDLPEFMEGGPNNPLGARALYLFNGGRDTLYRIHGSNEPWTIGQAVSSGCIRMRNEDVTELYSRVGIGTRVIVL
ncbi:MAG: L,D-transpeptidase [Hyphomicrobiales bacterium]|nr:L,D-transpeptidase [Hyphomicrobiales bacterium]